MFLRFLFSSAFSCNKGSSGLLTLNGESASGAGGGCSPWSLGGELSAAGRMGRITRGGGGPVVLGCRMPAVVSECMSSPVKSVVIDNDFCGQSESRGIGTGCWDWIGLPQAGLEGWHRDLRNIKGLPLFTSALCE